MSEIPKVLRYTEEHEWVREEETEGVVAIGITDYAQGELGDVVFVELPSAGDTFDRMEVFGTIEAVKAVSELYCPVTGEVVAVNELLDQDPAAVNTDPYGEGWMIQIKLGDLAQIDELLTADEYQEHIGG